MPTQAVTGTKHMKTTSPEEPAGDDPQQGHFQRRQWTDDEGVVHVEELRPGSKAWQEVKA